MVVRDNNKKRLIQEAGYLYCPIQTCTLMQFAQDHEKLAYFLKERRYDKPMSLRSSFYGGKVMLYNALHETDEECESIEAYDVCSLYPFILCSTSFPVGSPQICRSVQDHTRVDYSRIGMYSVRLSAPNFLHNPMIPYRMKDKRTCYSLCRT
jgi:hypothetical protein